jgi:hypothetical protein
MIVTNASIQAALTKTMQSVNDLSIKSSNGSYKAPVCIVCNCLCDSKMKTWISRKLLYDSRKRLYGKDSLPADIRKCYIYTGRGSASWMDATLLSPYASHKQVLLRTRHHRIDKYSCCRICLKELENDR